MLRRLPDWRLLDPVLPVLLVVGALLVGAIAKGSTESTVVTLLVNLVAVVGIYVFVGNTGLLSFGQVGFMSLAAYATGILTIPVIFKQVSLPDLPGALSTIEFGSFPGILVAALVAAALAALVAYPVLRTSAVAVPIATIAILEIVVVVTQNLSTFTGNGGEMVGIPVDTTLGVSCAWAAAAVVIAWLFQRSHFGLKVRAAREDDIAAKAMGLNVLLGQGVAFVLSGFLVGIAGGLAAHQLGALTPQTFYLETTLITLAMLIVGGISSLLGAVVGTIAVTLIQQVLNEVAGGVAIGGLSIGPHPEIVPLGVMVVLILVLILRPSGITGGNEATDLWRGLRRVGSGTAD